MTEVGRCASTGKGANAPEAPNAIIVMWAGKTSQLRNNNPQERHQSHAVMVQIVATMPKADATSPTTRLTVIFPRSRVADRAMPPGTASSPTGAGDSPTGAGGSLTVTGGSLTRAGGSPKGEGDRTQTGLSVDSAPTVTESSTVRTSIVWRIFPCTTTK